MWNHTLPNEPSLDTLCLHITYISHFIKPDSVNTYISGICNQLEPYFPTLSHDDLLFCTLLLTGFFTLIRLGELTDSNSPKLCDPHKTIWHLSVKTTADSYTMFLLGHKGDHFFSGNTIIILKNDKPYNLHDCFMQYLHSHDHKFRLLLPLWLPNNGTTPTQSWFTCRLQNFFNSSITGHSMQAGGAILFTKLETPPHLIQAIGHWKLDAFEPYIRKHLMLIQALLFGQSA